MENKAIDKLLISDKLFRAKDFSLRKIYNDCAEEVKNQGGQVIIFSSFHSSGEKLNNLSGIAAILRFSLNLDFLDDNEEDNEDDIIEEVKI